jgi:hypothetical protein
MQKFKIYSGLILLILPLIVSCNSPNSINSIAQCPGEPTNPLRAENIEFVNLVNNEFTQLSGVATQESMGYQFFATAGQTLQYETNQELCIWLYSPDNQLLKSETLPLDGNYIIQISSRKQQQQFELSLGLNIDTASNQSAKTSTTNQFAQADFPQSSCGDDKPNDPNLTSVDFYPINIPYSDETLEIVTQKFCRDAYQKTDRSTGDKIIQVASFTEKSKAQEFVDFIGETITGAYVGNPTTIYLNN